MSQVISPKKTVEYLRNQDPYDTSYLSDEEVYGLAQEKYPDIEWPKWKIKADEETIQEALDFKFKEYDANTQMLDERVKENKKRYQNIVNWLEKEHKIKIDKNDKEAFYKVWWNQELIRRDSGDTHLWINSKGKEIPIYWLSVLSATHGLLLLSVTAIIISPVSYLPRSLILYNLSLKNLLLDH